MEALCQNCYMEPAIGLHEARPSSGAALVAAPGCPKEEAEGSQRWKPAEADPWDTDGKLGHLFEKLGASV